MSQQEGWFYVRFNDHLSLRELESIGLGAASFVNKRLIKAYLTQNAYSTLRKNFNVSFAYIAPDNKLLISELSDANRTQELVAHGWKNDFYVECPGDFDLEKAMKSVIAGVTYSVSGVGQFRLVSFGTGEQNVEEALMKLAQIREIGSISVAPPIEANNRWTTGFIQGIANYGFRINQEGTLPLLPLETTKYINDKGLRGEGVNVLVVDESFDYMSTFFYDPNHVVTPNVVNKNHRKVVFYGPSGFGTLDNGHGTHVAGIVAGNAHCTDCDEEYYNGMAPDAKLGLWDRTASHSVNTVGNTGEGTIQLASDIDAVILTNSWGDFGGNPVRRWEFDFATFNHPEKLVVFAAGNNGEMATSMTIGSPGTSKNILTVGALDLLKWSYLEATRAVGVYDLDGQNVAVFTKVTDANRKNKGYEGDFAMDVCVDENTPSPCIEFHDIANYASFDSMHMNGNPVVFYGPSKQIEATILTKQFAEAPRVGLVLYIWPGMNAEDVSKLKQDTNGVLVIEETSVLPGIQLVRPSWSSVGATPNGIVKPDVVAPGTNIISALAFDEADARANPGHLGLRNADGTSMAAPMVSGAAALVQEYFEKGYYPSKAPKTSDSVKPSGCLLRAMLIASGVSPVSLQPDPEYGFGVVNLENVLAFTDSPFGLRMVQNQEIKTGEHLVGKVTVTGTTALRFAMSYLDHGMYVDSKIPLMIDLDMFIVSPSGKVFYGNQYYGLEHEHFSTNERVIIPLIDAEAGEYTIHVYSRGPLETGTTFALVVVGSVTSETITMTPASADVTCKNGGTATADHVCKCPAGYTGLLCQTEVHTLKKGDAYEYGSFYGYDSLYFRWTNPDPTKYWYVKISHRFAHLTPTRKFARHMVYLEGDSEAEIPTDFNYVETYDSNVILNVTGLAEATLLVRNVSPYQSPITAEMMSLSGASVIPPQSGTPAPPGAEGGKTMNFAAGVTAWVLFAVCCVWAIVATILCCQRKSITDLVSP